MQEMTISVDTVDHSFSRATDVRPRLFREALGSVLRAVRTESRRTLRDVADDARVSPGYLSELERGRKEASSELLAAISGALDISLGELLIRIVAELAPDHLGQEAALAGQPS